jgi:hypothetical protein
MILCEGPDGSGKTSLIKRLTVDLNIPVHERFCNSDGSPTRNDPTWTQTSDDRNSLFYHAYQDTTTLDAQPISIYDRHTMASEYVYGPIVRGELPNQFDTVQASRMIQAIASRSLFVLCKPPLDRLIESVTRQTHMDGVVERIRSIKAAYDALYVFWPGEKITFDYSDKQGYERVLSRARWHLAISRARVSVTKRK